MKQISLRTPTMAGEIYIGTDVLSTRLPALLEGRKAFVVTDSNVFALYPQVFSQWFSSSEIFVLPAGEENKNLASLCAILEKMVGAGMHRTSRLFAIGGGVVGDIGGFAAATYMRGVSCVQIPTTLLAQVDSSVGGKTAVDAGGVKNVVGAFYQPMEVLIDPTFLQTLPAREKKCGLGEIVKYAALNGDIFDALCENLDKAESLDYLTSLIEACVVHKARVVEADEKESGERKSLNVGHTTGHVIELAYGLSHGESVLYGTWLETYIAIKQGVCEREYGQALLHILQRALQMQPITNVDFSNIKQVAHKAKSDKKNADDGNIVMSVAKRKNEWTLLSLPFEAYVTALEQAVQAFTAEK